jgi:acetyl esterase/lipase
MMLGETERSSMTEAPAAPDLCTGMRRFVAEVETIYSRVPDDQPIADQRKTYGKVARHYTRRRPAGIRVQDMMVPTERGDTLRIRIYRPVETQRTVSPAILFFHGGGFALGSIESHDCVVAELALAASAVAISVDYRLAPENPFPAAFEDAYAVWQYAVSKAELLGIDPARTIVAGDSAGAALAAAICLKARDLCRRMPAGQLLIYPVLTAMADLPSYEEHADAPMLSADSLAYFWGLYTEAGRHAGNPLAAPLMASDFRGLPPARISTANYDPCRDDGALYAQRLREAGVSVEYRCAARLTHGYLRARAMSPAAAAEFAALGEGARALMRGSGKNGKEPHSKTAA